MEASDWLIVRREASDWLIVRREASDWSMSHLFTYLGHARHPGKLVL